MYKYLESFNQFDVRVSAGSAFRRATMPVSSLHGSAAKRCLQGRPVRCKVTLENSFSFYVRVTSLDWFAYQVLGQAPELTGKHITKQESEHLSPRPAQPLWLQGPGADVLRHSPGEPAEMT